MAGAARRSLRRENPGSPVPLGPKIGPGGQPFGLHPAYSRPQSHLAHRRDHHYLLPTRIIPVLMNRGNLEEIGKTWWCGDRVNGATGGEGNTGSTPLRGPHGGSGLCAPKGVGACPGAGGNAALGSTWVSRRGADTGHSDQISKDDATPVPKGAGNHP
jgi:hypothetical protein